jgi:hypothetical protein
VGGRHPPPQAETSLLLLLLGCLLLRHDRDHLLCYAELTAGSWPEGPYFFFFLAAFFFAMIGVTSFLNIVG